MEKCSKLDPGIRSVRTLTRPCIVAAHEGNKSFECSVCDDKSSENTNLTLHIKVPYKKKSCEFCNVAFCLKPELDKHIATVHLRTSLC